MWQVDFLIALERERERQQELERRRALREAELDDASRHDPARVDTQRGTRRPLRRLTAFMARPAAAVAAGIRWALDRPIIGSHHL